MKVQRYHNLKLDKKSSYFTTCWHANLGDTGTNSYQFGAALAGDMFQRKIGEIF